MVVLFWLKINGTYKQFVQDRVNHIKLKAQIQWHFVSTDENSEGNGSRGCNVDKLPIRWLERTTWFQSKEKRPKKNDIEPTKESEEGAKLLKEVFYKEKLDESQVDVFYQQIWILENNQDTIVDQRSSHNTKSKEKQAGPL